MVITAAHMARRPRSSTPLWGLTFSGEGSMQMICSWAELPEFVYTKDSGRTWDALPLNASISLSEGPLTVRTVAPRQSLCAPGTSSNIRFSIQSGSSVSVSGNIYALLSPRRDKCGPPTARAFTELFRGCEGLTDASGLDLNNPPDTSYGDLLGNPPVSFYAVPDYGMQRMFYGCRRLESPPERLLGHMLGSYACAEMFSGCTLLTAAPDIEAVSFDGGSHACYRMFDGCSNMRKGPSRLRPYNVPENTYAYMFAGCASLERVPLLMFRLVSDRSCAFMFANCAKIREVLLIPERIDENSGSYMGMFSYCEALQRITTGQQTFNGCASWVAGVDSSGDFICRVDDLKKLYPGTYEGFPIQTGTSYVPHGWTQSGIPSEFPPLEYYDDQQDLPD